MDMFHRTIRQQNAMLQIIIRPLAGCAINGPLYGRTIFAGLDGRLEVGRYHSLVVDPDLPPELERSASYGDVVMAVRHRELPVEGVQFHPESVLTGHGMAILRNFLAL